MSKLVQVELSATDDKNFEGGLHWILDGIATHLKSDAPGAAERRRKRRKLSITLRYVDQDVGMAWYTPNHPQARNQVRLLKQQVNSTRWNRSLTST